MTDSGMLALGGMTIAIVLGGGVLSLFGLKILEMSRESSRKNN